MTALLKIDAVISDDLASMINRLLKFEAQALGEAVERLLGGFEGLSQLVRFDVERDPAGTLDLRIVLKPSERFFDLFTALAG